MYFVLLIFVLGSILVGVESMVGRKNFTKDELTKALEDIRKENVDFGRAPGDLNVSYVVDCIQTNQTLLNVSDLNCRSKEQQAVYLNEVILRSTLYENEGEECTSSSASLLNPPPQTKGMSKISANFDEYLKWQNDLINSGQIYCNPFKHLHCAPDSKRCKCRGNLIGKRGICTIPNDAPCEDRLVAYRATEPNFKRMMSLPNYFYPLDSLGWTGVKNNTYTPLPDCGKNVICFHSFYLFNDTRCVTMADFNASHKVDTHFGMLVKRKLGESCDVINNDKLYTLNTTKMPRREAFDARIKTLDGLKDNKVTEFCDLRKFLTCLSSGKCECIPPTFLTPSKICTAPEGFNDCTLKLLNFKILMNTSLASRARRDIQDAVSTLSNKCPPKYRCHLDEDSNMYCTCGARKAGINCDIPLNPFLTTIRIPSLPSDIPTLEEKMKVFGELNEKARELSQRFVVTEGGQCSPANESIANDFIERISTLGIVGTSTTRALFQSWTKSLTEFLGNGARMCIRDRPLLGSKDVMMCDPMKKMCTKVLMCPSMPPDFCTGGTLFLFRGSCGCISPKDVDMSTDEGPDLLGVDVNQRSDSNKVNVTLPHHLFAAVVFILHSTQIF